MKTPIENELGLTLTPRAKLALIAIIIIGSALILALALTDPAGAQTLDGNKGGCATRNQWKGLACTVTDAGVGFVSGTCEFGFWFARVPTARTFRLDQAVTVNGCLGLANELYAPIRITSR